MARILYFSRDYTPHDHRFLTALASSPHKVAYLRLEKRGAGKEVRPIPASIEVLDWTGGTTPARWMDYPRLLSGLRRVIDAWKPDLIHTGPLPSAAFLAALTGFSPLVSMSWGSDILLDAQRSWLTYWQCQTALKHTTLLAADCQAVLDAASEMGYDSERSVKFPWGVDLSQFTPTGSQVLRETLGWQDNFVLLSLRAWEPIYGVDIVVRAFAAAVQRKPNLRLMLFGNGSQADIIQSLICQYHLEDKVYLGGHIKGDTLPDVYRSADVYVSASHSDGSSVSLMEALACGVPCLVSDIAGNREWITEGQEGWLFRDGSADVLAGGMEQAHELRNQLAGMRLAARRLAEQRANWQVNFSLLLQGYDRALQMAGGQA